jgi:hypothetical protein
MTFLPASVSSQANEPSETKHTTNATVSDCRKRVDPKSVPKPKTPPRDSNLKRKVSGMEMEEKKTENTLSVQIQNMQIGINVAVYYKNDVAHAKKSSVEKDGMHRQWALDNKHNPKKLAKDQPRLGEGDQLV